MDFAKSCVACAFIFLTYSQVVLRNGGEDLA